VFDIFRSLPAGTVTLRDLTKYVDAVAEKASAPGISGAKLLDLDMQAQENDSDLQSGVPELDELLGGFGGRRVIEISGDKQSGKTALALHVVLRHLAYHDQSCISWIDTTGDFSIDRAIQLLDSYATQAASTALERLQVSLAFDVHAVQEVLDELGYSLNSDASAPKVDCIVVDAITPLLGPLLSGISAQGHAIMDGLMRELRALAQKHFLSVLVINNTTSSYPSNPQSVFKSTIRKPALGPSFTALTDATLWLSQCNPASGEPVSHCDDGNTTHVAEVFRSRTNASNTWCSFKIYQGKLLSLSSDLIPDQHR